MIEHLDRSEWIDYFNEFSRRNQARPTRLEVFGENGAQEQEQGLPFNGMSLQQRNGSSRVEIMLGDLIDPRHLTHVICQVNQITPKLGLDGRDEALEIISEDGETNLLRFESRPMLRC